MLNFFVSVHGMSTSVFLKLCKNHVWNIISAKNEAMEWIPHLRHNQQMKVKIMSIRNFYITAQT